jgi:A/G-specific adenine glycosylase
MVIFMIAALILLPIISRFIPPEAGFFRLQLWTDPYAHINSLSPSYQYLLRVFSRAAHYEEDIRTPAALKAARAFYLDIMPEERPGDMNQALMDLGATVCLPPPSGPDCGSCPWSGFCEARRAGDAASLPVMPRKKARRIEERTIFVLYAGEKVLLRRRPAKGLLAGLYELPGTDGHLSEEEAVSRLQDCGLEPLRIRSLGPAKHIFTHVEWRMTGYEVWLTAAHTGDLIPADRAGIAEKYAIPSAFSAYVGKIGGAVV